MYEFFQLSGLVHYLQLSRLASIRCSRLLISFFSTAPSLKVATSRKPLRLSEEFCPGIEPAERKWRGEKVSEREREERAQYITIHFFPFSQFIFILRLPLFQHCNIWETIQKTIVLTLLGHQSRACTHHSAVSIIRIIWTTDSTLVFTFILRRLWTPRRRQILIEISLSALVPYAYYLVGI